LLEELEEKRKQQKKKQKKKKIVPGEVRTRANGTLCIHIQSTKCSKKRWCMQGVGSNT
jgi:hypothetical protein